MGVFLDRHRELSHLHERYRGEEAELVVLYGWRRVGKSEPVDRFLASSTGIRLLAREESKTLQLRKFSSELADFFQDNFLRKSGFSDWDSFFEDVLQHSGSRIVIAIDEFPYLMKEDPSLPSILPEYWDTRLKDTHVFLILSGSSISMMETSTMDHASPLFGRRTGQILLQPLRFIHVLEYLKDMRKAVELYSVFGGTCSIPKSFDTRFIFRCEQIIRPGYNTIYRILLHRDRVEPCMKRRKQRKWVRYERDHAMSMWQGDWKMITLDGQRRWLIAFMDDSSRLVTCYGVFDRPTTEYTIQVLEQGFLDYGIPREILTDNGSQFVSSRNPDTANHTFRKFIKYHGIRHIRARVNHPQTNGKIERFFGEVEGRAQKFGSVDAVVHWHNEIKPHSSLDYDEPANVFWYRLPPERILGYAQRWMYAQG